MFDDFIRELALQQGYSQVALAAGREADLRRQRLAHPKGRFDSAGRFFLNERCDCCVGLRQPSRAYPHSQMQHGRCLRHVANLYNAPVLHVGRLARAFALARDCEAGSNHAKAQVTLRLRQILKPVPPGR